MIAENKRALFAGVAVLLCFVAPMFVIANLPQPVHETTSAATVTVALGTIIRSNGRNIIKSTFMSAVRTGLRAVTRRLIRTMLPLFLRLFLPSFRTSAIQDIEVLEKEYPQPLWLSMLMGLIVLTLSFYGVVYFNPNLDANTFERGMSLWMVAGLAGVNLIIHYALMFWGGLRYNVQTQLRTSVDGIILQAYFTGALSYLPLASDVVLTGKTEDKGKTSTFTLLWMLVLSLLLDSCGLFFNLRLLEVWSTQLLLYVFVISFPLKPLEGSDIFAASRKTWAAVFALVLVMFLLNMPEQFYAIL